MLEHLLQMCSLSASRLNPCDMATYLINCLYAMHSTLALYEFTDQRLEMLDAQVGYSWLKYMYVLFAERFIHYNITLQRKYSLIHVVV